MTLRPSNRKRNRWAADLLAIEPGDHVLEIGFGPGLAVRDLARRVGGGKVSGIDHSDVMVRQATARNRAAIEDGRVELRRGSARNLGDYDHAFDKVLSVNNFGMWPQPDECLKQLHHAMRPGGLVAIVSQPRTPGADAATTERAGDEIAEQLSEAGFVNLRTETLPLSPPVACVLAETPTEKDE
jgi:ubiquinone/menaquinone biosynthesis C-methylase UbiE